MRLKTTPADFKPQYIIYFTIFSGTVISVLLALTNDNVGFAYIVIGLFFTGIISILLFGLNLILFKGEVKRLNIYFDNLVKRGTLMSAWKIFDWWERGRIAMNLIASGYTIIHLATLIFVFKNGWVFFYLPVIAAALVAINIFYSAGWVFEITATKAFKTKINFDRTSPWIKKGMFVVCIWLIIGLSALDILTQ
jgi:hypothetical protein